MNRSVVEPAPGRQVLVIGMNFDTGVIDIYRVRGALFVTSGWIGYSDKIPPAVRAIWVHPNDANDFEKKFPKIPRRFGKERFRSSHSLDGLKRFLDRYLPPPPERLPLHLVDTTPRPAPSEIEHATDLIEMRRQIASLKTQLEVQMAISEEKDRQLVALRHDNTVLINKNNKLIGSLLGLQSRIRELEHRLSKAKSNLKAAV